MRLPARPATALSPSPQLGINAGVRKFTTLHDFEDLDGDGTDDLTVVNGDWRDPAFPFGTSWLMSQGDGTYADAYAPRPDEPFGSVWYTRADFDGNGRTDFIITDYSGSWWYFDGVPGPWRQNVYYRPDLTYGNVEFTIGDFNGDGRSDYIVTTSQGSSWYFSDGFGGFYWVFGRPDLTLNNVHYTPGDFNGDGKTDLIVTTPSGSSWWASIGDGSWDEQYTRSDLVLNGVSYTPGDFNGDGKTDLVITTAAGSWWYLAVTPLPWYQFLFVFEADVFPVRPDLPLGTVDYTAADLNGDGMTDLVITNLSGSYWYILNGVTGTIYQPYTRLDLKRGSVRFKASDFNGDGRSDLLVTTYAGTDWLRSTTIGSGQLIASRPSLSLFAMQLF